MTNAISLLGSTGSIGRQTLEAAVQLNLNVLALSADKNVKLLEQQVRRFRPAIAAVFDESAAHDFAVRVADLNVRIVSGMGGLVEAACVDGSATVVTAIVGNVGLEPTLAAIREGRRIALANKETLVCAGELVMECAARYGAEIIPVDSEHSALFQCLMTGRRTDVKKLILTASGGPFRGMSRTELEKVTPEMALKHPNWSMGRKITIDSATMMNKGLEVVEAVHLFSTAPDSIQVVVHPESIIHSMVEFSDNSISAQLAEPDMRLPIQYALTFPERRESLVKRLDFTKLKCLTFEEPDTDIFPCLRLAYETARVQGTACAVMNAANEAAVQLFLDGALSFYGIYELVSAALDSIDNIENPAVGDIIAAGEAAKRFVLERAKT